MLASIHQLHVLRVLKAEVQSKHHTIHVYVVDCQLLTPVSCLNMQGTDLSPLNSLTQLTWLSLYASLYDARLAALKLGADMMVSL